MKSVLVLCTVAFAGVWGFNLTPPANTWVVLGQSFNLSCKASSPLTSCAWTTPYNKIYPLARGQTAEGGRFRHLGGEDEDCGIAVDGAEKRDLGAWICTVSVVNGSEVIPAEGRATVAEASAPDVELSGPFETGSGIVNVSRSDVVDLECVVNSARPKPEVSWFVDEEEIENGAVTEKAEGDVYVYKLAYAPKPDHENKSLRCVVRHVSLEREREVSVLVVFNDLVSTGETVEEVGAPAAEDVSYYIVAVLGLLVSLACGSILVSYMKGWLCFGKSARSPAASEGEAKLAEPGESTGSSDGKGDDGNARLTFGERAASLFRRKPAPAPSDAEAGEGSIGVDETETRAKFSEKLGALLKKGGRTLPLGADEKGEQDDERNEKSCWSGLCHAGRGASKGAAAEGNVNEAVEEKQVEYEPEEKALNGSVASTSSSAVHTSV